jgi:ATP-dependent DNA helicase RecQ
VALEFVWVDAEAYNGLKLHDSARTVLKGERRVLLREAAEKEPKAARSRKTASATNTIAQEAMDTLSTSIFTKLKAWRAAVATEHNIPAYIIFHDSTLRAIALARPASLGELAGVSGIGAKKLDAYGEELLRAVRNSG